VNGSLAHDHMLLPMCALKLRAEVRHPRRGRGAPSRTLLERIARRPFSPIIRARDRTLRGGVEQILVQSLTEVGPGGLVFDEDQHRSGFFHRSRVRV